MIPSDPFLRREMALSMIGLVVGATGFPVLASLYVSALKPGVVSVLFVAPVLLLSLGSLAWIFIRAYAWSAARGWVPPVIISAWILFQAGATVASYRAGQGSMDSPLNAMLLVILLVLLAAGIRAKHPVSSSPLLGRWESNPFLWGLAVGIGAVLMFSTMASVGHQTIERISAQKPWYQGVSAGLAALSVGAMVSHWSRRRWPGFLLALTHLATMLIIWGSHPHGPQTLFRTHHDVWIVPLGLTAGTLLEWRSCTGQPASESGNSTVTA